MAIARVVDIEGSGPRAPGRGDGRQRRRRGRRQRQRRLRRGAVVSEALAILHGEAKPRVSRSATATTRPSPSASPAAARSTCSSSRSTGERPMTSLYDDLQGRIRTEQPVCLATVIDGPNVGAKLLVDSSGPLRGGLGDPELDRIVARDALRRARGRPHRRAPLRPARRDHAGGSRRHADRARVHRVVGSAAADVDLRRGRLHRGARQGGQGARLPGHGVRRPGDVRHPATLPDGRRGGRVVAGPAVRPAWAHARRRATPCASSPTTRSSTCPRCRARWRTDVGYIGVMGSRTHARQAPAAPARGRRRRPTTWLG